MTENELAVRHWLNRAFYADKKVRALEMLAAQCRERAEGLVRYSEGKDTPKAATPQNGTESALMKLAEMEEKLQMQIAALVNVSDEISDAIAQLRDDDLETVLIHRYILFHTIEQTAEMMHYSTETVRRKTNKAISKLCENVLVCGSETC